MKKFSMEARVTFVEEMLGTKPKDLKLWEAFQASKIGDPKRREEETELVVDREGVGQTVFHYMPLDQLLEKNRRFYPRFADIPAPAIFRAGDVRGLILPVGLNARPLNPDTKVVLGRWDYEFKGFLKGATAFLNKADDAFDAKLSSYKKNIDGLIMVNPRFMPLVMPAGTATTEFVNATVGVEVAPDITSMCNTNNCVRPLRVDTAKGPRVSLVCSEAVPEGTYMDLELLSFTEFMNKGKPVKNKKPAKKVADEEPGEGEEVDDGNGPSVLMVDFLTTCMDYGFYHGCGQWRNSGKGRFVYEVTTPWHEMVATAGVAYPGTK